MFDIPIPDGLICKDMRVRRLMDLANAILQGHNVTPEVREKLKDYPYSIQLLEHMEKKRGGGLRSWHASPAPEATLEDFVREYLAMEWALSRGHSAMYKSFERRLVTTQIDLKTMKYVHSVNWHWFGDTSRRLRMKWCIFRDKKILRLRNPYEKAA